MQTQVILEWPHGLHVRRAAEIVQTISAFQARVIISANGKEANGRSLLELMGLGAVKGTELTIQIEGPDEESVQIALTTLFAQEKG